MAPERDALFLDFDGTLVDIAPTPAAVRPAPGLVDLLAALVAGLGGALAVVSGRPVADIDHHLAPLRLTVAGVHGHDLRWADGRREHASADEALLDAARVRLAGFTAAWPGTMIEDKGGSLALHYRNAPAAAAAAAEAAGALASASGGTLRLLPGKMVFELLPAGADKGTAVARILSRPPFRGRTPVFAGDDVTDEAGFVTAATLGGFGLRVGPPLATAAMAALPDVAALHAWLATAR